MDPLKRRMRARPALIPLAAAVGSGLALGLGLALWTACAKSDARLSPPEAETILFRLGENPVTVRQVLVAFQESRTFEELLAAEANRSQPAPPPNLPALSIRSVQEILQDLAYETEFDAFYARQARSQDITDTPAYRHNHEGLLKEELYQKVLIEDVFKKIHFTEDDLKKYYDETRNSLFKVQNSDTIDLRGIYIFTDRRSYDEARQRAEKALVKLQSGVAFQTVAREFSDASLEKRGEEMSASPDQFNDPDLLQSLLSLRNGEHTGILESGNKLLIYQRVKVNPPEYVSYENARELILRKRNQERREQESYFLYQQLSARFHPLLLSEVIHHPENESPDIVVLSVGDDFEMSLGEFMSLARENHIVTLQERLDYFSLLAQKAVIIAEARNRGWDERTVQSTLSYWDNKYLAEQSILHDVRQRPLSEEQIQDYYNKNPEKPPLQVPPAYDLFCLHLPANYSLDISHAESVERFQAAYQQAETAYHELAQGRPFTDVVALYSKDPLTLEAQGYLGRVTLDQLGAFFSTSIGEENLEAGEISHPKQVFNHKLHRYGYDLYYVRDLEPARRMDYNEARNVICQIWENGLFHQEKRQRWESFLKSHPLVAESDVLKQTESYLLSLAHRPDRQVDITRYAENESKPTL